MVSLHHIAAVIDIRGNIHLKVLSGGEVTNLRRISRRGNRRLSFGHGLIAALAIILEPGRAKPAHPMTVDQTLPGKEFLHR